MYTESHPHSIIEVILVWFLYIGGQVVPSMFHILFNPVILLVLQEITFLLAIIVSFKNIFNIKNLKDLKHIFTGIINIFKKSDKHGSSKGNKKTV